MDTKSDTSTIEEYPDHIKSALEYVYLNSVNLIFRQNESLISVLSLVRFIQVLLHSHKVDEQIMETIALEAQLKFSDIDFKETLSIVRQFRDQCKVLDEYFGIEEKRDT